jgi:hypothetical protein
VAAAVADDPGGLLAVATDLSGPSSSNPAPAPALARAPVQPASSTQATASQSQQNDALLALMATSGLDAASLADIIRNAARAPAAVAAAAVAPPAPASAPQHVAGASTVERQEQAELLELLRAAGGAGGLLEALRYGPLSSRFANGGGEDPVTRACERLANKKAPVTCSTYKPTEVRAYGNTVLAVARRFSVLPVEMILDHCVQSLDDRGRRWVVATGGTEYSDFKDPANFVDMLLKKFVGDKARDRTLKTFATFETGGMVLATVQRHVARCEADVNEVIAARGELPLDAVYYQCETLFRLALPADVAAAVTAALEAEKGLRCGKQRFEFVLETDR